MYSLHSGFSLTEMRPEDAPSFVTHLADRAIYERTLRIPYPYSLTHAHEFLAIVAGITARAGRPLQFAIRSPEGELIGCCGLDRADIPATAHQAELGYWLARPYWGRGLATAATAVLVQVGFAELGLTRLTAHIFAENEASARVVSKNGFVEEGRLRRHYCKDGVFHDARIFGRVRE